MTDLTTHALYQRAGTAMRRTLDRVEADDLDRPTPCTQWDVRSLLAHVGAVADALGRLAETGELVVADLRVPDAELVEAVGDRLRAADRAVASADPDRALAAATSGVVEFVTHGWDLASALGTELALEEVHADQVRRMVSSLVTDSARGEHFADPEPAPVGATALDGLAAFLGRPPSATSTGSALRSPRHPGPGSPAGPPRRQH